MIDLGLTKLAVIGVIALVVIGPEKLPKVARMAGTLYGRAQRYLNDVKSEVTREIELEELKNLQKEVQDAAMAVKTDVENSISQNMAEVENAFTEIGNDTSSSAYSHSSFNSVTPDDLSRKAREFRRKKLVRNSAIPNWYKQRTGGKMHVTSGAARVARFRPRGPTNSSFY
ncbi:Sec-independent protein translocase subunit TatB [Pseudoduganella sp. FT26W]|jgi:sec-independent protein translocase protein TatB|uniref:Sec-independent protein translocase protein TatB n=1 Tax=Duganella aquatilis TaxID=2666082 RepID=A0A844D704_9BURK|nr:Sec-independent protein translocase protein TatB [Duganella aquatilis]MRW84412.1 Sec-independent protein translocase subunit TatB [Duganella aquatilis]HCT26376.1 twin-arginine translocase subunit TatB [Stenotrophomonas sp.]